jgi:hypothetical protein
MPQNWWELFPEIQPSPAARPRMLPGSGGATSAAGMMPQARLQNSAIDPLQGSPSAFGSDYFAGDAELPPVKVQSPFPGGDGAPTMDRGAVIQQAAAAIQRGADPDAVHARLIQMGQGDEEPPSPFADLMPGRRAGAIGDSTPPPISARPAFDDQDVFSLRASGPGYAQGGLGNARQRLDPSLAPQKVGSFQKSGQQKSDAGGSRSTILSTYGLPSFPIPSRDQSPQLGAGAPGSTTLSTDGLPSFPSDSWARGNSAPNPAIHAFPLPNEHPLSNPSHVEGDDIVVTGPRRAARDTMRQIAQHSSELQEIGRLISAGEGNYESYNSGTLGRRGPVLHSSTNSPPGTVTARTINEIISTQSLPPTDPRRMFTVGRYQMTGPTLRGAVRAMHLTGNERLTPELQDRIFAEFLVPQTPGLANFIFRRRGTVDDAQYAAARQWASIALPQGRLTERHRVSDGTMTYYDKGPANRASVSATNALRTYLMNLHR